MENTQTEVAVFFKIIQQYRLLQTSVCRHYHIVLFFSLWNPKPLVSPFVSQWCSSVTHNSPSSKPLKWRPVFDDRCLRDRFQVLRAERLSAWQLNRTHLHLKWLFGLLLLPWRPRRFGPPLTVLTISFHYIGVFYIYMYIYICTYTRKQIHAHSLSHTLTFDAYEDLCSQISNIQYEIVWRWRDIQQANPSKWTKTAETHAKAREPTNRIEKHNLPLSP